MQKLQELQKVLPFNFISETKNGYLIDGIVFVYEDLDGYKFLKDKSYFPFDINDLSHLKELLLKNQHEQVLPEVYHLKNSVGKFSESDLYFLVAEGNVKVGVSTDLDMRIESLKTSIASDFEVYYIPRKGFLEKTMHHAFSDFHKNREWFLYNERFEKFIKENALRVNQNRKEVSPYIKSYTIDFGAYKGYDIKDVMEIDNKYCQSMLQHPVFPDKIRRYIMLNKK